MCRRTVLGVALCCMLPAALRVEHGLLAEGVLNIKDLAPFIGSETGTVREYSLNIWHWDGVIFAMFLLSCPSVVVGVWLIATRRRRLSSSPDAA
jgi:hypothetical protein